MLLRIVRRRSRPACAGIRSSSSMRRGFLSAGRSPVSRARPSPTGLLQRRFSTLRWPYCRVKLQVASKSSGAAGAATAPARPRCARSCRWCRPRPIPRAPLRARTRGCSGARCHIAAPSLVGTEQETRKLAELCLPPIDVDMQRHLVELRRRMERRFHAHDAGVSQIKHHIGTGGLSTQAHAPVAV